MAKISFELEPKYFIKLDKISQNVDDKAKEIVIQYLNNLPSDEKLPKAEGISRIELGF